MRISILGDGRVGQAVRALLQACWPEAHVCLMPTGGPFDLSGFDLAFGCLPGGMGPVAVDAAVAAGVDLVDVADLDPPAYAHHADRLQDRGVRVLTGAGLAPGLVSLLAGHELEAGGCDAIDVAAGSLSNRDHVFPILWCFEDMVAEHDGPCEQVLSGERQTLPAWSGLQPEDFGGLAGESYFCQSGFEGLMASSDLAQFTYRNLRPRGFHHFFRYLAAYGAFEPAQLAGTKALLEGLEVHNRSVGRVVVARPGKTRTWWVEARAEAHDALNSMQRVTAAVAVELARLLHNPPGGAALPPGLWAPDELGRQPGWVEALLPALQAHGVRIQVTEEG